LTSSTEAKNNRIIGASWVIPIDGDTHGSLLGAETATVHRDHGLLIVGGKIAQMAPYTELVAQAQQADPDIDVEFFADHIMLPGLVNCHGHAAMSLLRGFADDYALMPWLEQHIWPAESQWLSESFVRDGTTLAVAEMLLAGTTTFSDMYFFPEASAEVAESHGVRAQINFPIIEFSSNWASDTEEYFAKGLDLFDNYRHSKLVSVGFGPHAPYTVSDASFERVAVLAEEIDTHIQIHLQESAAEVADSVRDHGASPIERLHRLGVLGPRTQAVHLTQFNERDIELLAQSNTSAVHCPASNAKLASGYSAIKQLLAAGLHVGLGTDGAASNNTLDLFDSARLAALQAKLHSSDATALNATQSLHLATQGGANALGLGEQIGSLSIGKQADIIAIDTRQPGMQPVHNPISQLIYTQAGSAVNHVWIDGEAVVRSRELLNIDLAELLANTKAWREKLAKR